MVWSLLKACERLLEKIAVRKDFGWRLSRVSKIPEPIDTFVSTYAFHHLTDEEKAKAIKNIVRY